MLACAISIERESASILAGIFIFSFVLFVLHWASDWCNFSGSFHYQLLLLLQWERKRVLAHSLSLANCRELGNGIRIVLSQTVYRYSHFEFELKMDKLFH